MHFNFLRFLLPMLLLAVTPYAGISQADSTKPLADSMYSYTDTSIREIEEVYVTNCYDYSSTLKKRDNKRRKWLTYGSIGAYAGALVVLDQAWYSQYKRSGFHFYNDNGEWNQVDKVGHGWSTYQLTGASYKLWKWAGVSDKKALTHAAISGVGFLTVIELLDGFSSKWGFSTGDMAANVVGSGLFIGQQALWKEQRVLYKFSFHHNNYKDPLLKERADELFGSSWNERMLKDYNAQTYWLSANINSFFPELHFPKWLNIAVGYGANNMYGGYTNEWTDKNNISHNRNHIKRTREFYLAPDIDLTKIKTKSKILNTIFYTFNSLKIPAPTITINSQGRFKAYPLYF